MNQLAGILGRVGETKRGAPISTSQGNNILYFLFSRTRFVSAKVE